MKLKEKKEWYITMIKKFQYIKEWDEFEDEIDDVNHDDLIKELWNLEYIIEEGGNSIHSIEKIDNNGWVHIVDPELSEDEKEEKMELCREADEGLIEYPGKKCYRMVIRVNDELNWPMRIHLESYYHKFIKKCKEVCAKYGFTFDHHRSNGFYPGESVFVFYPNDFSM